ncbi:kinectin isoform X2 [Leguminivora glycinivorella]|uniref:kinectin isoform X2 n=1 Tax=Leguminivora glycinivorella TaxID=1035111 RepID=UPI002010BAD5|nr:kinectin isoform X2 [Leguminivora glycinivorella]
MQTVLVLILFFSFGVLGHPDLNQNIDTEDQEHHKIVEDLQQRSVKLGKQIKKLKALLQEDKKTIQHSLDMIESCKKRNVDYLSQNQMLRKENEMLKEQVEECTASKQESDRIKEEAAAKLEECSAAKEAQDRALEAKIEDIKEKDRILMECEQQNKILQNNNDELDRAAAELENDIERAQAKISVIRSKLKKFPLDQMQQTIVRMGYDSYERRR